MDSVRETLRESIFEVFEKMFFVFLERGERAPIHDCETSIGFDGPLRGVIRIFFTRPVAELMVRNMLGLSAGEEVGRHAEDCLKEAANMVCGNFLVNYDASKKFAMSLPEFSAKAGQPSVPSEKTVAFDFDCEAGRMTVTLEIEGRG